jgi:FtsH-binding integral membrane protein
VDTLLRETERTPTAGKGTPPKGKRRRRERKEQTPQEMQAGLNRVAFVVILVIAVIGYVDRTVARRYPVSDIWNNGVFSIIGVFAFAASVFLLMRASRVGRATRERISPAEASRMFYVTMGGFLLWLVPLLGSVGYTFGIVFQTSNMHPLFYIFVGGGMLSILYGLSGSKERGSFLRIYMFGIYGIVLATIPMALPALGAVLASTFWWSATFILVSLGFILMAMMVRQMRVDQYAQLDAVLDRADKSFVARRYDEAQKHYSEAITLTHTLYSDQVFSGRNPRERGGSRIPKEYFRPWIGKAKCLALTGKLRKALAIYELMLEVDPDNPTVWFDRGRILVAEKRYAEAYISFDRAIKLDPQLEEAKKARSEVLDVIRKMAI